MAKPEKYAHINFKPPQGARKEAEKSLAWRREFGRGGTAVGIARARDLANGVELSPSTVRRMKAFFDRHQKNKSAPGWSPDEDGFPSNSRIAWAMWGSDAGWSWAKKVVEQMNAADEKEKNERGLRPYGSTHGMRPKVYVVHGAPCSGKKDYVAKHLGENDVVFDYDEVMAAISGRPIYQPNSNLVSYCLDIRTLILKKALQRSGADKTWIITTRVGDDMKSQLSDVPVKYVHIDTPKEECLQRLEQDEQRQPLAQELRQVIDEYFKTGDEEQRRAPLAQPGVERRYIGNFSSDERLDPELLRIEKRSDPETGKPRTYIVGYAARFHRDSLLLGDFVEQIDPGAFEIVTNRQDEDGKPLETRCLYNHDPNHLLGRFPTTMRMVVDDKGLRYECLLPNTELGRSIEELVARSDLKGSSFSFVVAEGGERWTTENGQSRRIVTKVKSILDCGPVTYPAYSDSSVSVAKRSYEAFVAEQRDCGRDEDGKFGSGNDCAGGGKPGGGKSSVKDIDKAKKAAKDFDRWSEGTLAGNVASGAAKGAAYGALIGTMSGVPGATIGGVVAGAVTGAAFSAVLSAGKALVGAGSRKFEKAMSSAGVNDKQLGSVAAAIFGGDKKSPGRFSSDGKTIVIESGGSEGGAAFVTGQSQFGDKSPGTSIHFQPGADTNGRFSIAALEKAAKSVGAKNVSVEVWDDKDVKKLESKGYRLVAKSPDGYSSSKGVYEKKMKASRRSLDRLTRRAEILRARIAAETFLAERRDCGRGEDGKFGSGNKCQEDEGSGSEPKSGSRPQNSKGEKVAAEQRPPAGEENPKYMELSRPMTASKAKQAQKFADDARKRQEAKTKEKSTPAKDDGSGVQTWSKGDVYPWTAKQVGDSSKGGYVQGQHPDGTKTKKYEFPAGSDGSDAYRQAEDEIKKKNKRSLSSKAAELRAFLEARR